MLNRCTDIGTSNTAHRPFFWFLFNAEGKIQLQTSLFKTQRLIGELWQAMAFHRGESWCSR